MLSPSGGDDDHGVVVYPPPPPVLPPVPVPSPAPAVTVRCTSDITLTPHGAAAAAVAAVSVSTTPNNRHQHYPPLAPTPTAPVSADCTPQSTPTTAHICMCAAKLMGVFKMCLHIDDKSIDNVSESDPSVGSPTMALLHSPASASSTASSSSQPHDSDTTAGSSASISATGTPTQPRGAGGGGPRRGGGAVKHSYSAGSSSRANTSAASAGGGGAKSTSRPVYLSGGAGGGPHGVGHPHRRGPGPGGDGSPRPGPVVTPSPTQMPVRIAISRDGEEGYTHPTRLYPLMVSPDPSTEETIRAPPNRTVFDGESPPPYRSKSFGGGVGSSGGARHRQSGGVVSSSSRKSTSYPSYASSEVLGGGGGRCLRRPDSTVYSVQSNSVSNARRSPHRTRGQPTTTTTTSPTSSSPAPPLTVMVSPVPPYSSLPVYEQVSSSRVPRPRSADYVLNSGPPPDYHTVVQDTAATAVRLSQSGTAVRSSTGTMTSATPVGDRLHRSRGGGATAANIPTRSCAVGSAGPAGSGRSTPSAASLSSSEADTGSLPVLVPEGCSSSDGSAAGADVRDVQPHPHSSSQPPACRPGLTTAPPSAPPPPSSSSSSSTSSVTSTQHHPS